MDARPAQAPQQVQARVLEAIGRAMGRFAMLRPRDRVAVGVSGGKDSLCLLHALIAHRRRAPFPFDLVAVTVEQGKFTAPVRGLQRQIEGLGVHGWFATNRPPCAWCATEWPTAATCAAGTAAAPSTSWPAS